MEEYLKRHSQLWLVMVCAAAFLLTYFAPVDASFSDPGGALITAQAIVESGTIRLDSYNRDDQLGAAYVVASENGHVYDYFPIGTAIASVPAVWLARLRGQDMLYLEDNRALQNTLSSLTVVACVVLIYLIARLYLSYAGSFALTLLFVFGTSTVSTLGTALWSTNLALVLGLSTVFLLARSEHGNEEYPPGWIVGGLLFFAYLCRPTMALLCPFVVVYAMSRWRRIPWQLIASLASLSCSFLLLSWLESGSLLPPYYRFSRLGGGHFFEALYGHVLSPSRGVLLTSPFLFVVLIGSVICGRRLRQEPLAYVAIGWITLHWLMVSSFHHWWGGWSFGNRLFADVIPGFVLLAAMVSRCAEHANCSRQHRLCVGALVFATGTFAVFAHSHQGLFNVYSILWNRGIDQDPSRVFDWKRPQLLANPKMLQTNERVHAVLSKRALGEGEAVLPTSEDVVFQGWSIPEGGGDWRWSSTSNPKILVKVKEAIASSRAHGLVLEIETGTYQPQVIEVKVNGLVVGELVSAKNWEPATYELAIPEAAISAALRPLPGVSLFEIEFGIPGAVLVGEGPSQRLLGLCLRRLALRSASGEG